MSTGSGVGRVRSIKVIAPAKVNLHLGVGGLCADGYHELTGVFHTLELHDDVEMNVSGTLEFKCDTDLGVDPQNNLAHMAAVRLAGAVGRDPAVSIRLTKRIPHGAGLGGGSSDAAAVLVGLAAMWDIDPADSRVVTVARTLGADVAFFLEPSGAALMTGRGDVVRRRLPALTGAPAVLVRPPEPVSTAAAYAAFDADPVEAHSPDTVVEALVAEDIEELAAGLTNNLEEASMAVVPAVSDALAWTRSISGVLGAVVAGSGSAVFALVDSDDSSKRIAEAARARGWWGVATRLGGHGVQVVTDEE